MKVIKETIGGAEIFIQTLDDGLVVLGDAQQGRATQVTGIQDGLKEAYQRARAVIKEIAQDMGAELKNIAGLACPNEVEMEFSLGISTEGKVVWLVSGKGEFGMKVKMSWKLETDDDRT
ncbi:MAG TPA: CU044_2847 family protein [Pyrinomonadaceae bacterium]|nr:CU044_2847 family protein [Pyrinomonadaceae bacterium]